MNSTTTWISSAIREQGERRGWTQGALADRLGRTQTAISYWEAGKRTPGLDDLLELAEALECDVEVFIPPDRARRPVTAVLRATAERLASAELDKAIDDLIEVAEREDTPPMELVVSATAPSYAANELLERAGITRPPIDIVALARRCGVLVLPRRLPDALSGLVFAMAEGAVIGVNSSHSPNRQRFSTAHELGHYLLGHHRLGDGSGDRLHIDIDEGTPPGYDWRQERAANDFAADLLMPRRMIANAFGKHPSPQGLARLFEVSEMAMGYRLVNLGLR